MIGNFEIKKKESNLGKESLGKEREEIEEMEDGMVEWNFERIKELKDGRIEMVIEKMMKGRKGEKWIVVK